MALHGANVDVQLAACWALVELAAGEAGSCVRGWGVDACTHGFVRGWGACAHSCTDGVGGVRVHTHLHQVNNVQWNTSIRTHTFRCKSPCLKMVGIMIILRRTNIDTHTHVNVQITTRGLPTRLIAASLTPSWLPCSDTSRYAPL